MEHALKYMGLAPNTPISEIRPDKIFIGSCTNSRIEDLRAAADVVKGKHIASSIKLAMVVPGSGLVKHQAEQEGLDKIFRDAGFEWREPGCSMCLAMNDDRLESGRRCASTSNRNFEGQAGARRPHASGQPCDGGSGRGSGTFCGCAGNILILDQKGFIFIKKGVAMKMLSVLIALIAVFQSVRMSYHGWVGKDIQKGGEAIERQAQSSK